MRLVVLEHFPSEIMAFDLGADSMIDDLYSGKDNISTESHRGEFQFVGEASSVLGFVSVLCSTFLALDKVYDHIRKSKTPSDSDSLQSLWEDELKRAGIKPRLAGSLTSNFMRDIKRQNLG